MKVSRYDPSRAMRYLMHLGEVSNPATLEKMDDDTIRGLDDVNSFGWIDQEFDEGVTNQVELQIRGVH